MSHPLVIVAAMSPSEAGARAEAAVLAGLVASGRGVLVPFSGHHRYDLAFDEGTRLARVQCKTGRVIKGAIYFRTHSTTGGRLAGYADQVDYFGVHCPETGQVYLIPAQGLPPRGACLRLEAPANGQQSGIRWARDYLLGEEPSCAHEYHPR